MVNSRQLFVSLLRVMGIFLLVSASQGKYDLDIRTDPHSATPTRLLFLLMVETLIFVSLFWFIGKRARNQYFYFAFMAMLVLHEIGIASFLFFAFRLSQWVPTYKASSLDSVYRFMDSNGEIMMWFLLGSVILEIVALCLLALYLQARNQAIHDSKNHPTEINTKV
ncbi:hypothetical protein MKW94_009655 [Papaver nudicaule]|uniref:Uncharacterized protein n=1 Tax=Papaver nudicaule TaxID=74823 RepID=A0AA41VGL6_PAPNU|nr:hypothetical protein [Papaver nudicaule]